MANPLTKLGRMLNRLGGGRPSTGEIDDKRDELIAMLDKVIRDLEAARTEALVAIDRAANEADREALQGAVATVDAKLAEAHAKRSEVIQRFDTLKARMG